MSIIVFVGPTIAASALNHILKADYRPPARQGDVYLACQERPKAIAIIDGYFQNVPAVWHKEILYAMSQGIHVLGASSMGALRSAELADFGMIGIGKIYQQYLTEQLQSDDEVAIVHAPGEVNYIALSDALVNIRATFIQAEKAHIINSKQRQQLMTIATSTWYPKRCYQNILTQAKKAAKDQLDERTFLTLSTYCQAHSVDIKKQDAIALINHLKDNLASLQTPKQVDYHFAYTDAWQNMIEQVEQQQFSQSNPLPLEGIIKTLKAQGKFQHYYQYAQARQFALEQLKKHQTQPSNEQKNSALIELAQQQNCINDNQIDFAKLTDWFEQQQLTHQQFDKLIQNQATLTNIKYPYNDIEQALIDVLRLDNQLNNILLSN